MTTTTMTRRSRRRCGRRCGPVPSLSPSLHLTLASPSPLRLPAPPALAPPHLRRDDDDDAIIALCNYRVVVDVVVAPTHLADLDLDLDLDLTLALPLTSPHDNDNDNDGDGPIATARLACRRRCRCHSRALSSPLPSPAAFPSVFGCERACFPVVVHPHRSSGADIADTSGALIMHSAGCWRTRTPPDTGALCWTPGYAHSAGRWHTPLDTVALLVHSTRRRRTPRTLCQTLAYSTTMRSCALALALTHPAT